VGWEERERYYNSINAIKRLAKLGQIVQFIT
jgi:hypothetical protein